MINKLNYELNPRATYSDMVRAGFKERNDYLYAWYYLHKNMIQLCLRVDKGSQQLCINVIDINNGSEYAPFWNPDLQLKNDVCAEVIYSYNNIMKRLEEKGIVQPEKKPLYSFLGTNSEYPQTIRIKYHTDKIEKLNYIDGKSDWIDLRSSVDVKLKKGEFKLISLGVSMELPEGYEAHIVPRSSTYKNFGLIQTNHCGIVDGSYCGDNDIWKFPALAMRDTEIHVNDRICQFRIVKNQPKIVFNEVKHLNNKDRGGIGSTGKQ